MKLRDYFNEVIKGKDTWTGTSGDKKVKIGQEKNGMYFGEVRDKHGDIESSTTKKTMDQVKKWLDKQVKNIKWLNEEDNSGTDMRIIIDMLKKAKNEKEFDIMYNEMGKSSTRIGKLFKSLNKTAKKTLMDRINDMKDEY